MTASLKLYEIADMRDVLDRWLAESEGEVTPELEELLAQNEADADQKIENVALFIREMNVQADAVSAEANRLSQRAASLYAGAKNLKLYLEREMVRLGKEQVKGVYATVAMQKNGPSVVGDADARSLWNRGGDWAGFVRYTPASFTLDRRVVLDAYKKKLPIPEGLTVVQTESLRIR